MDKKWVYFGLVLVVGMILGAATYHYYKYEPDMQAMEALVSQYESQISELQEQAAAVNVADLTITANTTLLNFTTAVASDGSVASDVTKVISVTIENTETDLDVMDLTIDVKSASNESGIPAALENEYFDIYVVVSTATGTQSVPLYKDGVYYDPYVIASLPAGAITTVELKFVLNQAPAGVFEDGGSYTLKIYFRQPHAGNYEDKLSLTVTT